LRPPAWLVFAIAANVGCRETKTAPLAAESSGITASASAVSSASASATVAETAPTGGPGSGQGGGKKSRFGEATLYVDGEPKGVIRILEMPPQLKIRPKTLEGGREVNRWRISEYLEVMGVDLAKVKELHLLGGRDRCAVLKGDELRKHAKTLLFSFSKGTGGKARIEWPDEDIEVTTTIDTIVAAMVYIDKVPPKYDREKRKFIDEKGEQIVGVPYAQPEAALKGTRIYLDGKLVGAVKRKRLPNSALAKDYDPKKPRFSLEAYLQSLGVDTSKATTASFIRGDNVYARYEPSLWKSRLKDTEFSLDQGSEGKVIVHLGGAPFDADAGAGDPRDLPISALLLHQTSKAPLHVIASRADGAPPGSSSSQPAPEDPGL
jgi:hypothetical protein